MKHNKLISKFFFLFLFVISFQTIKAQRWGDYTLYSALNSTSTYLLDTAGNIFRTYNTFGAPTGAACYLAPGGNLYRAATTNNNFNANGTTGRFQRVSSGGTVQWDITYSSSTYCGHNDFHVMPNGNILIMAYETRSASEVVAAGSSVNHTMWMERIIEIQPSGFNGGTIVWQWNSWNHLSQNYDSTKTNYVPVIWARPERLNINYNNSANASDWLHFTGIDYNAELDQIVVSSQNMNEYYVIDHSTTTAQAATSSGGNSGKGGDILYRWGNPAAYSAGSISDQIFNTVNDAHWVPNNCPRAGNLVAFNNNATTTASSIDIVIPPYFGYNYSLSGIAYSPSTYSYRRLCNGKSSSLGSSQQLPNGNTLITMSNQGYIYEIDSNGTTVWSKTITGGTGLPNVPQALRYAACYVNGTPTVTATTNKPSICAGTIVSLGANPAGGSNYTYVWKSSPVGLNSTSQNPVVNPIVTTTYTVTVTSGLCSASSSVTVTVIPQPVVNVNSNPSTICLGTLAQLSASMTGPGTYTYAWVATPGLFTSTLQNPIVSPTVNTTYLVTATGTTNGCTDTGLTSVNIAANPTVIVSTTAQTICVGSTTRLIATASGGGSGNAYSYLWTSSPAGFNSTISNPYVTPTQTTVYTVKVKSTLCTDSTYESITIRVNTFPTVVGSSDSNNFCAGGSTQLRSVASGGDSIYTYAWTSTPTGFTSTLQNPIATPTTSTIYMIRVTSGGCTSAPFSVLVGVKQNPAFSISTTTPNICYGTSAQLNITIVGDTPFVYSWSSNPSGFSSSIKNPIVSPLVNTAYSVFVTSALNCSATSGISISIKPRPTVTASATSTLICSGGLTRLSATVIGDAPYTYSWTSNPAGFTSTIVNPFVNPTTNTTYTVVVTSGGCTDTASSSVAINIVNLTATTTANSTLVCPGINTMLYAIPSGGSIYTYTWRSVPIGFTSTIQNPVINPTFTRTYFVTVKSLGCTDSANSSITINVKSIPTISVTASSNSICSGSSSSLNATVIGDTPYTYIWSSIPAGFTSTIQNPIVTPTANTVYRVIVTNAGCNDTASASTLITVSSAPSVTAVVSSNIICAGSSTQLNAIPSGGNGGYSYLWYSSPGGFTSTLQNPTVSPMLSSTYTVIVTSNNCTGTSNVSVTVNAIPYVTAVSEFNPLCIGSSTQLNALSPFQDSSAYSYSWSSIPSGFTSSLKSPIVAPSIPTTYNVIVNNNGCVASSGVYITIAQLPPTPTISQTGNMLISSAISGNQWYFGAILIPGATTQTYSPSLNGIYSVQVTDVNKCNSAKSTQHQFTSVGINDISSKNTFKIYPNPSNGILNIESDVLKNTNFSIVVFDAMGKCVYTFKNTSTINLSDLRDGLYSITIKLENGSTYNKNILLNR